MKTISLRLYIIVISLAAVAVIIGSFYRAQKLSESELQYLCQKLADSNIQQADLERLERNVDCVDGWYATSYFGMVYRACMFNQEYLQKLRKSNEGVKLRVLTGIEEQGKSAYETLITNGWQDLKAKPGALDSP